MKKTTLLSIGVLLAICSTGLLAQSLPEPRKGDTVGWHEVRAGETLSGLTERYLGDASLWPENHRLNPDVADPDRLTPGQRIRVILSREVAARRADIEQVSRRVEKKPRADDWTSARAGDQLVEREGLRTYPKSSAELGFDDGSNLVLTENSIVFLREYTSTVKRIDRSLIEVVDGGVDVAVTPKAADRRGKDIEIVMGDVKARPRATGSDKAKTRAVKDQDDSAKLMVYAGASDVESAGVNVRVAKGQGTSVRQGEAPAPPEPLLAAPKPVSPAEASMINDRLEASWSAVPRAASYTIEVCRDQDCARLVDRLVGVTSTSIETSALPSGELYWRVTAKSASGLDGYPSKASGISVARRVAGRVQVDRAGANDASSMTGVAGTVVRLFRDDGDGMPGAADALVEEKATDDTGAFAFDKATSGTHWLAVDSRSASLPGTWLEQAAGPAGSLCADGQGGVTTLAEPGPCFGGRQAGVSDDFTSLASSEHVVKVEVADEAAFGALDVVFSPSVVTTTVDGDDAPQGSLRRFLQNSAAIAGDDAMRFVPMEPAGGEGRWWTIDLVAALPPVDDVVTIDGRAWSPSGERRDVNEGQVSNAMKVGAEGADLAVADRPELEIFANGAERPLLVRSGTLRVRDVALYGAAGSDITSVGRLEIENSLVGVGAGMTAPETAAALAIDVSGSGSADISSSFVRAGGSYGVYVRSDSASSKVEARDVAIVNCAVGAAVRLESSGSTFERIHVSSCGETPARIAFEMKGTRSTDNQTCRMNEVSSSTIVDHGVGVQVRMGAVDNTIERTLFERVGNGVELEFVMGFWVPKGIRITRNEWRSFGEPIALTGIDGVMGKRYFEGAVSCADGAWLVARALDFPGSVTLAKTGSDLDVSAVTCPGAEIEGYLESNGTLEYLGTVMSDSEGNARGILAIPPGATRIGFLATGRWHTTSRMSLHEIK